MGGAWSIIPVLVPIPSLSETGIPVPVLDTRSTRKSSSPTGSAGLVPRRAGTIPMPNFERMFWFLGAPLDVSKTIWLHLHKTNFFLSFAREIIWWHVPP